MSPASSSCPPLAGDRRPHRRAAWRLAVVVLAVWTAAGCWGSRGGPSTTPPPDPGVAPPAATPTPAPQEGVVLVEWIVYRQRGIAFFEVYRGLSADGPWEVLTRDDEVILGEGDSDEEIRYSFLDRGLAAGKPYHYRIRRIDVDGRSVWFSRRPITKVAVPKSEYDEAVAAGRIEPPRARTVDRAD